MIMLTFPEIMFMLVFFGLMALFLIKLYNLFLSGTFYGIELAVLGFITSLIFYGLGFFVWLNDPTNLLYMVFFRFMTLFVILGLLVFVAEVFFLMRDWASKPAQAYSSFVTRGQSQYKNSPALSNNGSSMRNYR